jgi:hypothetical protein
MRNLQRPRLAIAELVDHARAVLGDENAARRVRRLVLHRAVTAAPDDAIVHVPFPARGVGEIRLAPMGRLDGWVIISHWRECAARANLTPEPEAEIDRRRRVPRAEDGLEARGEDRRPWRGCHKAARRLPSGPAEQPVMARALSSSRTPTCKEPRAALYLGDGVQ